IVQRGAGGMDRHVRGRLALGGEMTPLDAGALADPLVAGVQPRLEPVVADHALGQVMAAAADDGTQDGHGAVSSPLVGAAAALPAGTASATRAARRSWNPDCASRKAI